MRSTRPLCLILGLFLVNYLTGCSDTGLAGMRSSLGLAVDSNVNADANRLDNLDNHSNDNSNGVNTSHDVNANVGDQHGSDNNGDHHGNDSANDNNGEHHGNDNEGDHHGNENANDNEGEHHGNDNNGEHHGNENANDNDGDRNGNDNDGDRHDNGNPSGLVGDAITGAELFVGNSCTNCHGADGSGPPNILGEGFASLDLRVRLGQNHLGGAFPDLTDQDLADIQAFLLQ